MERFFLQLHQHQLLQRELRRPQLPPQPRRPQPPQELQQVQLLQPLLLGI